MNLSTKLVIGVSVGVAAAYLISRAAGNVTELAKDLVTEKLNPVSDQNIIYDGVVGGVGRVISGDEHWSLGGWIYDITH
jgi:hypothetical protein